MDNNKKGYHSIAISTERNGGNRNSSEPEKSEQNQLSRIHFNNVIIDVKEAENTVAKLPPDKGRELYFLLLARIKLHIAIEEYQAAAVTLWIMKTWCTSAFKVAPILVIMAMTPRAGKTQLLSLVALLSRDSLYTPDITPAALFRYIDIYHPTVCIDEADSFGVDKLRGILNAGFNQGSYIVRCIGPDCEPVKFSTFCDKAIAGIGALPETIQDRSIVIQMLRKRESVVKQKISNIDPLEIQHLTNELKEWGDRVVGILSKVQPTIPQGLSDRKQDCWEPLLAIAELLGEDIVQQAKEAAIQISGKNNDEPNIYEELLKGIKTIFEQRERVHISTQNLIAELCEDVEAPWCYFDKGRRITPRQLAQILKQFDISSKQIRIDRTRTLKGYLKADFIRCFRDHHI